MSVATVLSRLDSGSTPKDGLEKLGSLRGEKRRMGRIGDASDGEVLCSDVEVSVGLRFFGGEFDLKLGLKADGPKENRLEILLWRR